MNPVGGAANVVTRDTRVADEGMVHVGGVTLSPADAAEFVMLHRTAVMKRVGADRTEMAQQHLDRIRTARRYLTDIISLRKFCDAAKSYKDRVPVTPDMVSFLKNEVGASPGEYVNRLVYYNSAVPRLPESVRKYYGFDGFDKPALDNSVDNSDRPADDADEDTDDTGGTFIRSHAGDKHTHGRHQISGVTVVSKGDLDSIKEEVNNYIDQQNDSNNLFMTRFKSVVNSMNEALEGANSMADKSHDAVKNLVSRW